jgi:hypothetical protein
MEGNEEIFDRIMQDASFRDVATSHLMREGADGYPPGRSGKSNQRRSVDREIRGT